jgi:hypothetical protein
MQKLLIEAIPTKGELFTCNKLAVPRLGNVQLRFHFLRRGTSRGNTTISKVQVVDLLGRTVVMYSDVNATAFKLSLNQFQKGTYLIQVLDSEGKPYTSKIQR